MKHHTKGPWRVGDAGATIFGPSNGTPTPETIATITHAPIVSDQKKANARLIAAAPCLLDALKHIRDEGTALPAYLRAIAELAIVKAEGT